MENMGLNEYIADRIPSDQTLKIIDFVAAIYLGLMTLYVMVYLGHMKGIRDIPVLPGIIGAGFLIGTRHAALKGDSKKDVTPADTPEDI